MRRISRIQRPIGLLNQQTTARTPSPYLCLACKLQTSSLSTSSTRPAPKVPYTEKIRQKIWGTDAPPGQEDPYGDASVFDRTKKGKQPEEEEPIVEDEPLEEELEAEENAEEEVEEPSRYALAEEPFEETEIRNLRRSWLKANPAWEPERQFEGFLPSKPLNRPNVIANALRRALIEAFAMRAAKLPLESMTKAPTTFESDWTRNVQIVPSSTKGATIHLLEDASLADMMEASKEKAAKAAVSGKVDVEDAEFGVEPTDSQEEVEADRSEVDPLEDDMKSSSEFVSELNEDEIPEVNVNESPSTEEITLAVGMSSKWKKAWLLISLTDLEIKFAVLKRTMQLTGVRISDSNISLSNSALALLRHLITQPKPRNLAAVVKKKGELLELKNVSVHAKKKSTVDKERDIGRLKVINKELEKRSLAPLKERRGSANPPLRRRT